MNQPVPSPTDDGTEGRNLIEQLVFAGAVALTLVQTVGPSLYSPLGIDEQVTYYLAAGKTPATVFERSLTQSATPPAYFWLARLSLQIGELVTPGRLREWWLRLPALLAFLALLPVTRQLADRRIGRGTGAVAVLLLSIHADGVYHATQARPYTIGMFASAVALSALLTLRSRDWRTLDIVLFIVANLCLVWTHYLFAVVVVTEVILLPFLYQRSDGLRMPVPALPILLMVLGICCGALPLMKGVLRLFEHRQQLNWITEVGEWYEPLSIAILGSNLWIPFIIAIGASLAAGAVFRHAKSQLAWRTSIALVLWLLLPIYALWFAGLYMSPALAQSRYMAVQAGAGAIVLSMILSCLGRRAAIAAAIGLLMICHVPSRVINIVRNPVRHDSYWKDAATTFNNAANEGDLVFVQSGLVETILVPVRFSDNGFQEYTTSRLSDFYLKVGLIRRSLPLFWSTGDWLDNYTQDMQEIRQTGGNVWLIVSADSDIGSAVENNALAWLRSYGVQPQLVSDRRVAKIYRGSNQ